MSRKNNWTSNKADSGISVFQLKQHLFVYPLVTFSIKIWEAVSFLMARCDPLIFKYMGSWNGATWTSSTELPGKHPISSNFKGIWIEETSVITPCSPRFKLAKLSCKLI